MSRLTARRLELFNKPGKGAAANEITAAVGVAARAAIQQIGRKYDEEKAITAICDANSEHVYPVLCKHIKYGATDSEPRRAVRSELCNRIAKRYGLQQYENDDLYYSL